MIVQVRRATTRYRTRTAATSTWHSFAFGAHYDPANTSFGPLVAHNEELVHPGPGYPRHPHRELEIVSYVVDGTLRHEDSLGGTALTAAGQVQVLSAGTGVEHAERAAGAGPVRFVQMWLLPDRSGPPSYQQVAVSQSRGDLVPVVSGDPQDRRLARIRQRAARLYLGRLAAGSAVRLPVAALVHVFLLRGTTALDGGHRLKPGDALRLTDCAGPAIRATTDAELLVWELRTR